MLKVYLTRGNQGQGVWLDLPTSPAEMGEAYAVLDGIDSENLDTRISATISSVPNLKRYIQEHDPLKQLDTLATVINKMSDRDAAIFSGALDLESVNGIEDVIRIASNLQNYELFPDVTTPRELGIYLVESGEVDIHKSAWPYLDYERVAVEYESNNGGSYTNLGYVVRSDDTPTQTISEEKQMMRIFFPLKIFSYPQYDCSEDEREDISSKEAVAYEDQILAAIAKENRHFENDRGLAEYLDEGTLKEKVHSLYPSVETVDGELWGVMTAGLKESLSGEETAALLDYVCGQNSDGYGEGLEQRPIKTPDGEIYVSFWNSDNYFLKPEQELKQSEAPDLRSNTQAQPAPVDDKEYIFKLQVYPSYEPESRDKGFTLKLPLSKQELGLTLAEHGINDFSECDVASCECNIKRLSNTLNLEGDIDGLNRFATQIKHMLDNQEPITKFLSALEVERPRELSEAIDIMDNLDRYELLPQNIKTPADYACHVLFDSGRYEIDDEVKDFLNLDKYGKYKMEEDGVRQSVFGMLRRIDEPFQEQEQGFTQQMGGI